MKRVSLSIAPLVLGLVIGPMFETALMQTSALGSDDLGIILQHPIAINILAGMLVISLTPIATRPRLRSRWWASRKRRDLRGAATAPYFTAVA